MQSKVAERAAAAAAATSNVPYNCITTDQAAKLDSLGFVWDRPEVRLHVGRAKVAGCFCESNPPFPCLQQASPFISDVCVCLQTLSVVVDAQDHQDGHAAKRTRKDTGAAGAGGGPAGPNPNGTVPAIAGAVYAYPSSVSATYPVGGVLLILDRERVCQCVFS